jgi:dolichol-phosphate mannosyltransferase
MRNLIVIPTYNEIENLQSLTAQILSITSSATEILVVDDGSPDGTGSLADALAKEQPRIHVLHRSGKMGLGTAYVAGFKWGLQKGFDGVIEMDADFSHHPKYLPRMIELLQDNDVVVGSRYVKGGGTLNWGLGRKVLSKGGSLYSRIILGAPIRDFTGGFNGWKRHVLESIGLEDLESDGYSFQIELKYRAFLKGYHVAEFPIVFEDRKVGYSKMNKAIVFEALAKVWRFRFNAKRANSSS